MVGFFREKNSFHVIILVLIAVLVKLSYLLHPPVVTYLPQMGLLPAMLNRWYSDGSTGFSVFLSLLIQLGSALYANAVISNQRMFSKPGFIVAVCMVLMWSLVPEANLLTAPLLLLPLFISIYQQLTSLYNSQKPRTTIYNIGLAVGIGTLLYHPYAVFLIAVMGGIASMRTFRIQDWLILLLGLATPYYIYLSWLFLTDNLNPHQHIPFIYFSVRHLSKDIYSIVAAGILLIWIVAGIGLWQQNVRRMLIQARKNWNLLLLLAILCLLLIFVHAGNAADSFVLAVFPFSCFAAPAFIFPKKLLWPTLLFWIVVLMVILISLRSYDGLIR